MRRPLPAPLNGKSFRFVRACVHAGEAKLRGREENDSQRWWSEWKKVFRSGASSLSPSPALGQCVSPGFRGFTFKTRAHGWGSKWRRILSAYGRGYMHVSILHVYGQSFMQRAYMPGVLCS